MTALKSLDISVTTTGSAGSASGSGVSPAFCGEVVGIYLNWHASAPATSDVTITDTRTAVEIASEDNNITDKYISPAIYAEDKDGAALTSNVTPHRYCVSKGVTVAVAQADALTDCLVATVFYRS